MLNVCVGMIKNKEESLEGIFMGENSQQNQIEELKVYAAFCSNKLLLENSASGGVATALSVDVIKSGGYVAGVSYTSDFHDAEYILVNDLETLKKLQGSKYIRAKLNGIYEKVKNLLESGIYVLFIGLPCNIAGLKKYCKKDYQNLLTCELICDGPTKTEVHKQYIEYLEKKNGSKLDSFSVRHKKYGWPVSYLRAEFENGKVFSEEFYFTEYGYAFQLNKYEGCFNCQYKGLNYVGDLMIGDFWGAKDTDVFWNSDGISAILVRNERADKFLKSVHSLVLFEENYERVVPNNKRIILPNENTRDRQEFSKCFNKDGLFLSVNKMMPRSRKMIIKIKRLCPSNIRRLVELLYYKTTIKRKFH